MKHGLLRSGATHCAHQRPFRHLTTAMCQLRWTIVLSTRFCGSVSFIAPPLGTIVPNLGTVGAGVYYGGQGHAVIADTATRATLATPIHDFAPRPLVD